MYTPAASAFSDSQRPSCAIEVTWLPWLRNGGGVGKSGAANLRVMKYTRSLSTVPYVGHSSSGTSGSSSLSADGFIIPPDSRCEPGPLPFSTSATGTSPSDSASCGSSSSSWVSRIAQASPAGPPPTMATPTSIRSSSGSVGGPMNSSAERTGGGYSTGAVGIVVSVRR